MRCEVSSALGHKLLTNRTIFQARTRPYTSFEAISVKCKSDDESRSEADSKLRVSSHRTKARRGTALLQTRTSFHEASPHTARMYSSLFLYHPDSLPLSLSLISSLLLFFRCYFIDDSCGNHAKPSILHRHVCTAQEQNASYTRARSSILLRPETTCAQKQTRTKRRESRELRSPRNTTRGIKRYRVEEGEHVLLKRERTGCWDCVKRMTAAWLETEW